MKKKYLSIALFLFLSVYCFSIEFPGMDVHWGLIWIGNAEEEGAPSPLLPTLGVSLPVYFAPFFFLDPGMDFYGTSYQLSETGSGKAVPTEIEYANYIWYLIMRLDIPAGFRFNFSDNLAAGVTAGPSFLFRIPLIAWGDCAQSGSTCREEMGSYFYCSGRFFYPEAGLFFIWKMFNKAALLIEAKTFFPLFHAWDGEEVPFYDQFMVAGSVGLRFFF